ncbi:hypothetical protein KBY96_11455 [Cyanobium sp. ATX 6A2]|uniref:hypothetical protein n=1 Tax=Cyanobium sp. ATX 6A2 TaxID=2823700 RepID=UPI0020CE6ADD|nr:hypothetical protein [Cyanobium sp. ATX 6A2]MCP9888541.1 hypothetical protein [Cyanobium sp. ATX 6A2]
MKQLIPAISSLLIVLAPSAFAQTISQSQMRAANLARMQAEVINDGLSNYSSEKCMHQTGGGSCMVQESSGGYRFRFLGGAPGWDAKGEIGTLETVILVSPDGRLSRVEYNGPVRVGIRR